MPAHAPSRTSPPSRWPGWRSGSGQPSRRQETASPAAPLRVRLGRPDVAGASAKRGLNEDVVRDISRKKSEPEWMLDLRLKGLQAVRQEAHAHLGLDLSGIDFDNIKYFVRSTEKQATTWDELPEDIKNTYDRLGIPEAEKQRLVAGVAAQYESEVVYHKIREDLEEQGVLFLDTDTALREHEDLFREYFGSVIPVGDNKFAALNTAVWSGGSFIYVPQGRARRHPAAGLLPDQHREHGPVRADADHRRRGRLRALRRGLHGADLQQRLAALRGGRDHREEERPLPLHDHPELVQQRLQPGHQARGAHEGATMEWIDGNIGSKVTMKYPAVYLIGEHAKGETLSVAFAGEGQHQDAGAKMVHAAPHTSQHDRLQVGRPRRRPHLLPRPGAGRRGCPPQRSSTSSATRCWSTDQPLRHLPLRRRPRGRRAMGHEATVSKVSEDQLFYLMSRGLSEDEAMAMIVRGFVEPIARELPMEYALELNRLIELQMEGAVG
jgi:Fe-S cluster assembly protein SufB